MTNTIINKIDTFIEKRLIKKPVTVRTKTGKIFTREQWVNPEIEERKALLRRYKKLNIPGEPGFGYLTTEQLRQRVLEAEKKRDR